MRRKSSDKQIKDLKLSADANLENVEIDRNSLEVSLKSKNSLGTVSNESVERLPCVRGNSVISQKPGKLLQVLEAHKHERQIILLQDFPDPDALSSAWTYQLIAQQYDIKCDIAYAGTLSHQENIALVKLTKLPAMRTPLQSLKSKDLSTYQGYILIDNQGTMVELKSGPI